MKTATNVIVLLSLVAFGCSSGDRPPLGQVTGTVTLDGEPLTNAIIMFMPDTGGRPATATIGDNGEYELIYRYGVPGAKVGPSTVSFSWPTGEPGLPIPEKYGGKSELKAEVKPGDNTFDFHLESK